MTDDKPVGVEVCADCGLSHGFGIDECSASHSVEGGYDCERLAAHNTITKLRAEVEALRARVAEQAWVACSERMPELSERVWFVAQDGAGLVRKGEFNGDRFVTVSGFSWEPDEVLCWMHRPLEPARPSPPSNLDTTATKEGE